MLIKVSGIVRGLSFPPPHEKERRRAESAGKLIKRARPGADCSVLQLQRLPRTRGANGMPLLLQPSTPIQLHILCACARIQCEQEEQNEQRNGSNNWEKPRNHPAECIFIDLATTILFAAAVLAF